MNPSEPADRTAGPNGGASALPWAEPPALTVLDPATTGRLIDDLPEETFKLIVREAYLFRAGQIIVQGMQEAKARHELVSASRPPFLVLRRSGTRDAFTAELESATADCALFEGALRRNADAMKRLRQCAEVQIERWLRENDEAYYSGLVSESLVGDWRRCLTRLETGLGDFIAALGCARNSLVASMADTAGVRRVSEVSRKAIDQAARMGDTLAREVMATNGLADARDRHLQGTAFAATFPRLPSFDFYASLDEAAGLPVSFLQEQFGRILERCQELRSVGLPALLQQVEQAETNHAAVKKSYLLGIWQGLRDFALEHYVEDADLQEVAKATEQMFEQGRFVAATAGA